MNRESSGSRAARALVAAIATLAHAPGRAAAASQRTLAFPDDPSVVVVEPPSTDAPSRAPLAIGVDRRQRALQTNNSRCQPNEALWIFNLFTDQYPWETAWKLFDLNGAKTAQIASGPPEGTNYERETRYVGALCLKRGQYVLRMLDKSGDGLCCDYGEGTFKVTVNGKEVVKSDDADFRVKGYRFNVAPRAPVPQPLPSPNSPPTRRPTGQQAPASDEPEVAVSFVMIGDAPYRTDHRYCLNEQLRALDPSQMAQPYKFIIHVGDIMSGKVSCDAERYSDVAEMFAHESNAMHYDPRDVFFVIGDNEWADCDDRDMALSHWMNEFGNGQKTNGRNTGPNPYGYGTSSNGQIRRTLAYDNQEGEDSMSDTYPSSASNFAFFHNKVLFLGINQVGGSSLGDEVRRLGNNFRWAKTNMAKYKQRLKSVVVFAHADMDGARWNYFGKPFQQLLRGEYPDTFVMYAHGDWHEFWVSRPDAGNTNLVDLSCDSGERAEPLLVSITRDPNGGKDGLVVDRRGGRFGSSGCDEGNREKTWSSRIS